MIRLGNVGVWQSSGELRYQRYSIARCCTISKIPVQYQRYSTLGTVQYSTVLDPAGQYGTAPLVQYAQVTCATETGAVAEDGSGGGSWAAVAEGRLSRHALKDRKTSLARPRRSLPQWEENDSPCWERAFGLDQHVELFPTWGIVQHRAGAVRYAVRGRGDSGNLKRRH